MLKDYHADVYYTSIAPPPPSSSFYVPLSSIPHFHPLPDTAPLHIWAGHLLAEPDNFIPPGPNETPKPNLEVQTHLYFVLLKARRASDRERLIFWFNGGPGCSSFDGLMMEVGPWRMQDEELRQIEGGWEEYANIVYSQSFHFACLVALLTLYTVDQPVGTGYSYGSTENYIKDLADVPDPVIEFMRNFFKVFPEMANMDVSPSTNHLFMTLMVIDRHTLLARAMPANTFLTSQMPFYPSHQLKHFLCLYKVSRLETDGLIHVLSIPPMWNLLLKKTFSRMALLITSTRKKL